MGVVSPPEASRPSARTEAPSEPTRGGGFGYNPALDGIRAFAVLAVLLFHGGVLTGGYLGVDAFFVLSGFLITSLILHEIHTHGRLDLTQFWVRRARRLLPALFVFLFAVCAYAVVFADRTELRRIRGDALATLFYVANWHAILSGHGYWDLFAKPSPLEHMWSLAIEEQFYLLWPLVLAVVIALCLRSSRRHDRATPPAPVVATVALVAGILSALWCSILFRADDSSRAYLGTDTRVAALLFGAAFAAWAVGHGPVRTRAARVTLEVLAVLAAVGVGIAWARLDGQDLLLYRGGLLLSGLGVLLVIAAVTQPGRGPLQRVLAWRPLVAIGLISYGLYLWHWPIYIVLNEARTGLTGNTLLALRITVSFAVAIASYWIVERPFRHLSLPRHLNLVLVPLVVVAIVGAIFVTTGNAADPPQSPLASETPRAGSTVSAGDATLGRTGPGSRILIAGDSVAGNIANAAQAIQPELGRQIGNATIAGCVLPGATAARTTINLRTQEITFDPCVPTWQKGFDAIDAGRVLLVYGTAAAFTDLQIRGRWVGACDAAYKRWYAKRLTDVIATAAPDAAVHLALLPPIEGEWLPAFAGDRIDCINGVHRRLARTLPNVATLDLAAMVCPDGVCRETIDGQPFRIDGFHFSPPASTWLARKVVAAMTRDAAAEPGDPSGP